MNIVGVSCFYHDSAACLIQDGLIVAACSEERFTRVKTQRNSLYMLSTFAFSRPASHQLISTAIAFYEKPFLKFHRVMWNHLVSYPFQ